MQEGRGWPDGKPLKSKPKKKKRKVVARMTLYKGPEEGEDLALDFVKQKIAKRKEMK